MSNARDTIKAEMAAEAQYITKTTRIDLVAFLALKGEVRAARWRMLDPGAKFQLCAQAIARQTGRDWTDAEIAAAIALYDEKYSAGPIDAAVEGALERLAIEHSDAARLADRLGDLAHRKVERAAATAFTNALVQYRNGVRPELLASGARLIPSSRPGQSAHLVTMDGDFVCNCAAGANMHWPIALCIGLEVTQADMERFDDPPADPTPAELGQRLCAARQRCYSEAA